MTETTTTETIAKADYDKLQEKFYKREGEIEDLKRQIKEFEGVDLKALKAMKEDYDLLKKEGAKGDTKKIDELLSAKEAEIRKETQRLIDERDGKIKTLSERNKELEVVDKVFGLASSRFVPQAHDDVREYIRKFCDKDAEGNIIVKDDVGKPRFVNGSASQRMGPDHFVDWLAEQKPHWAVAKGTAGVRSPGATSGATQGETVTVEQYKSMTPAQRQELPREVRLKLAPLALK